MQHLLFHVEIHLYQGKPCDAVRRDRLKEMKESKDRTLC